MLVLRFALNGPWETRDVLCAFKGTINGTKTLTKKKPSYKHDRVLRVYTCPFTLDHGYMIFCELLTCFIEFIAGALLIKLRRFQVYNSIMHRLHIVLCICTPSQVSVHHHVSPSSPCSTSPTPLPSGNHHTVVCVYEMFLTSIWKHNMYLIALYWGLKWNYWFSGLKNTPHI